MSPALILAPAAVLVLWTLVMLLWMVSVRLPAMSKMGSTLSKARPGGRGQDLEGAVDPSVMWKAHNHTHLHEQPTLFYAVVGILAIMGAVTDLTIGFAWAYVVLRIAHSIYQATVNVVLVRFSLFLASVICLAVLAVSALVATL